MAARRIRSAYPKGRRRDNFYGLGHLTADLRPNEKYDGEFKFFINEARKAGGVLAEFAAGAGRVSMPLAQAGIEVYALEASPHMIRLAQKAAKWHLTAEERKRIHYIQGDMRRAILPCKVPLIIIPYSSFWYNYSGYAWNRDRQTPKLKDDISFLKRRIGNFLRNIFAQVPRKQKDQSLYSTVFNPQRVLRTAFNPSNVSVVPFSSVDRKPPDHYEARRNIHRYLQAEYCVRSILRNLLPGGKFIIDAPGDKREWWDFMALTYGFQYEIKKSYDDGVFPVLFGQATKER